MFYVVVSGIFQLSFSSAVELVFFQFSTLVRGLLFRGLVRNVKAGFKALFSGSVPLRGLITGFSGSIGAFSSGTLFPASSRGGVFSSFAGMSLFLMVGLLVMGLVFSVDFSALFSRVVAGQFLW